MTTFYKHSYELVNALVFSYCTSSRKAQRRIHVVISFYALITFSCQWHRRWPSLTSWTLRGEGGGRGNMAHVVPVTRHPDVALLAPVSAPRVLHEPVVGGMGAVADRQNRVVDLRLCARAVNEYTCRRENYYYWHLPDVSSVTKISRTCVVRSGQ